MLYSSLCCQEVTSALVVSPLEKAYMCFLYKSMSRAHTQSGNSTVLYSAGFPLLILYISHYHISSQKTEYETLPLLQWWDCQHQWVCICVCACRLCLSWKRKSQWWRRSTVTCSCISRVQIGGVRIWAHGELWLTQLRSVCWMLLKEHFCFSKIRSLQREAQNIWPQITTK